MRPEQVTAVMRRCPQWQTCSAPDCPLDPKYMQRGKRQKGEPVCRAQKPTRLRVAAEAEADGLTTRFGGLTSREAASKRSWEAKTPEQQEAAISRGKKALAALHGSEAAK